MYDTMQYISAPVHTLCMGTARSMGSFLLMAGEPGHRAALANASLHVHQPLGGVQGRASDIFIHAEEMQRTKQRITRLYAQHCGRSVEEVEQTRPRSFHECRAGMRMGPDRPGTGTARRARGLSLPL